MKKKQITLNSIVKRIDDNMITSELGDDLVMMDINTGSYLSLNETGHIIWQQIENPIKVEDIVKHLMNHFEVEASVCAHETIGFLTRIQELDALQI